MVGTAIERASRRSDLIDSHARRACRGRRSRCMPLRAAHAKRIISGALVQRVNSVWISDDLLRSTFNSFFAIETCHCKRYGSNVPGPMEATRRLAKRRMNNVTVCGVGQPPGPPPLFNFDWFTGFARPAEEPEWTWEPPWLQKVPESEKSIDVKDAHRREYPQGLSEDQYPRLPAWLDVKHPITPPPPPRNWSLDASEAPQDPFVASENTTGPVKYTEASYKARLEGVKDLADLRTLHTEFRTTHIDAEICSRLDFDHLLECYEQASDPHLRHSLRASLFDFLQDEALELSDGRNLARLARILSVECRGSKNISVQECRIIITLVSHQLQNASSLMHNQLTLVHNTLLLISCVQHAVVDTALNLLQILWQPFSTARLHADADQDAEICMAFLQHTVELPKQSATVALVKDILRVDAASFRAALAHEPDGVDRTRSLRRVKENWGSLLTRGAMSLLEDTSGDSDLPTHSQAAEYLLSLESTEYVGVLAKIVARHLASAIDDGPERPSKLATLNSWLLVIRTCVYSWRNDCHGSLWHPIFQAISRFVPPADIVPLLSSLPPFEVPWLVLKHWISLTVPPAVIKQVGAEWTLKAPYLRTPLNRNSATQYFKLLAILSRSRLDHSETALEHILALCLALRQWHVFDAVARFAKKSAAFPITIRHRPLLETYINASAESRPELALRLFNMDRRALLTRCEALPVALITSPHSWVHPRRIMALLSYSDRLAFVELAHRDYDPRCALTPQRVVLVHEVAMAFATAERFRPRAAWTYVMRCYAFLRGNHAPVGPMMTRALVIAGLLRQMRQGTDVALGKLRFVLRVVAGVDGAEAADELDRVFWAYRKELLVRRRKSKKHPLDLIRYQFRDDGEG